MYHKVRRFKRESNDSLNKKFSLLRHIKEDRGCQERMFFYMVMVF